MRFRTVFIAISNYTHEIKFPKPEYYATAVANFHGSKELCYNLMPLERYILKNKTTVWDAIGDLPEIKNGENNGTYDYCSPADNEFKQYARNGSVNITSHFCSKLSAINIERLKYMCARHGY